jgi:hypothetical protein
MGTAVLESQAGAGGQVAYRPRHEDLVRLGRTHDAGRHTDGEPCDVIALDLDLADVDARTGVEVLSG